MLDKISSKLKAQYFLVAFIAAVPVSAYLLRQNNLTMLSIRDEVLAVDTETGDFSQVQPKLEELGSFVFSHMNTNAGVVELPGVFGADVERLRQQAAASGGANAGIYAQAQARCEDPSILLAARAQCIQDFVTANAEQGDDATVLNFPDKALYSYSFSSPIWSPDLAGFSVLFAGMSFILFTITGMMNVVLPAVRRSISNDPLE